MKDHWNILNTIINHITKWWCILFVCLYVFIFMPVYNTYKKMYKTKGARFYFNIRKRVIFTFFTNICYDFFSAYWLKSSFFFCFFNWEVLMNEIGENRIHRFVVWSDEHITILHFSKVIYPKHSKNWPYSVAHTIDCVCCKMLNHGLNHVLFLLLFKLIPCPIHVLNDLNFILEFQNSFSTDQNSPLCPDT